VFADFVSFAPSRFEKNLPYCQPQTGFSLMAIIFAAPSKMLTVPEHITLNCRGRLLVLDRPVVMGILNLTPDSFSDGGQFNTEKQALQRVEDMLKDGATIIDVGGYSSRPGAVDISPEEELGRVQTIVGQILRQFPEAIVSIDTFRASVAGPLLDLGVHIVNDISAGLLDPEMLPLVGRHRVPYVLMHMQGRPQTMQVAPKYGDVVSEVAQFFVERIRAARMARIQDIVLDPGFGFGKTLDHNWELFRNLGQFKVYGLPILIGISRKSMVYRLFDTQAHDVLELTTALHLKALEMGARILRVHDVRPALRAVQLHHYLQHGSL
jgi:dihydropteroate synthase